MIIYKSTLPLSDENSPCIQVNTILPFRDGRLFEVTIRAIYRQIYDEPAIVIVTLRLGNERNFSSLMPPI